MHNNRLSPQNPVNFIIITVSMAILAMLFTACDLGGSERWPSYTVIFHANGGVGVMEPATRRLGVQENLSAKRFKRSGHTFYGWAASPNVHYSDVQFTDQEPVLNVASAEGAVVRLYAIWRAHTYTIVFYANGGIGEMKNSTHIYDVAENLGANAFTRTGHNFLGWAKHPDGEAVFADGESVLNLTAVDGETIKLYALWGLHAFEVAYNPNGGTGTMGNSRHSHDIAQNLRANTFTRVGHTFTGWARSPGGTVEFADRESVLNLAVMDGETIRLYAVWRVNTHTVAYSPNGGTGTMANSLHSYGTAQELNVNTFTRLGHTFIGWARSPGGNVEFADRQSVINLTATDAYVITLYARWRAHTFTVVYNANGGVGNMASSIHTFDTAKNLRANSFTRVGQTFVGWARSPDGSVEFTDGYSVANLTTEDDGVVTLYAAWVIIVTFDINGGEGAAPAKQMVSENTGIAVPNNSGFSRDGAVFGGWNTLADGTGANFVAGEIFTPTENVTLYARWIATWTATAHDAAANSISFTFGVPVSGLTAADITVTDGTGSVTTGALTGGGTSWSLAANVTRSGNVLVSIARSGIEASSRVVGVSIGIVTITGTVRVGNALTADTSNLGGSGAITFQWKRGGIPIPGENGNTYNIRIADVGWTLSVTVTRLGYDGIVTSAPTVSVPVHGDNLDEQFAWLLSEASKTHYVIELDRDQVIPPQILLRTADRSDVTIILRGIGGVRTISLGQNGTLLAVGSGVTLELGDSVTLSGRPANNRYLVRVDNEGTLIMNKGARITGNIGGGGVNVNGGAFYMHGGSISGNRGGTTGDFGGVNVGNGGRFTIYAGMISGNYGGIGGAGSAGSNGGGGAPGHPGGVGNPGGNGGSGGVNVNNGGTFTMYGGVISDNRGGTGGAGGAGGRGGNGNNRSSIGAQGHPGGPGGRGGNGGTGGSGGVNVHDGGRFVLYFGTISNNHGGGGGVGGRGGDGGTGGSGGLGAGRGPTGAGGLGGNGGAGGVGGNNVNGTFIRDSGAISNNSGGNGGNGGGGGSGSPNGGSGSSGTAGPGNGVINTVNGGLLLCV